MGVDQTTYLMFATDVGADAFDWDEHEAEYEGRPGARFDIVYDGMSGEYCMAGKIIAKSDPYEGFRMTTIKPDDLAVQRDLLADAVGHAFGLPVTADDFNLILFTHFS